MGQTDRELAVASRPPLALLPFIERGLTVADVDSLHAAQVRVETKVDHVLEQLRELAVTMAHHTTELRDLRDRVLILEERNRAGREADVRAVEDARWANIERWLIRIGAAIGAAGTTANAVGLF